MEYEAVIGLEVHVQLKTRSKMFTRAPYQFGEGPNTLTDPVVMALPGVLPVLNLEAIRKSVQVGLIFDSEIPEVCKWDRKNYFYPDSPKNYQITQFDQPICVGGMVEVEMPGESPNVMGAHRHVQLTRAHLEEDVGKLTHSANDSLVDYNRAGAPLLEIVTEPDIFSAEEAFWFLASLRMHLVNAELSDCDMEKGQLRCDANISIRPKGETKLGTKVELKNLNSISGVRDGISFEIKRQVRCMKSGEEIIQETRRWDADRQQSFSMRSKEMSHDYRYFPDPDLMPVKLDRSLVDELKSALPERPFDRQRRFMEQFNLPYTVTSVLCHDRGLSEFFEASVALHNNPKSIANLVANDLQRELIAAAPEGEGRVSLDVCKITPQMLADLVKLVDDGVISKQIAQDVFIEMYQSGDAPEAIVEAKGLKQESDSGELEALCKQVIEENPKPAQEYKEGNEKAINALKGRVMKATQGKANPQVVDKLLRDLLA